MTKDDTIEVAMKMRPGAYAIMLNKFGDYKSAGGTMLYSDWLGWFVSHMIETDFPAYAPSDPDQFLIKL